MTTANACLYYTWTFIEDSIIFNSFVSESFYFVIGAAVWNALCGASTITIVHLVL